ncbi:uL22 family ribosomal protein [Patescibacteria group bacterium]|nr:uL22 family ribosomal protein [Patescibacteria group bacterium]MBU1457380.1 uL22 family ribosomal protein [Patescibacteria group bacterium]
MKTDKTLITIIAKASHAPATPRKANLILESLIGQNPQDAINELQLLSKRAAQPIIKLLKQALGNAADQHKLTAEDLVIEKAFATKGRVLKFVRFAGRGRVKPYQKIASHLTIILKVNKK